MNNENDQSHDTIDMESLTPAPPLGTDAKLIRIVQPISARLRERTGDVAVATAMAALDG